MFEFVVRGIVQGVGFRPYIYNKSNEYFLKGYVQNIGDGVRIVCDDKEKMLSILDNVPVLAIIEEVEIYDYDEIEFGKGKIENEVFDNFVIKESVSEIVGGGDESLGILKGGNNIAKTYSPIPADLNLCDDCLRELFEKGNRREKYFFISCTNCGPRFSIVKSGPYDRSRTSLDEFEICDACRVEYENPKDRRYHAQTIACPNCGPELSLYNNGRLIICENIFLKVLQLIEDGEVVAIKGVGGFHLICSMDDFSVIKLKKITGRKHKPFALMAKDISMIKKYAFVSPLEKKKLMSKERPIVLLEKLNRLDYMEVSELSSLGFMLPYSPIHYLLFENIDFPLIFTSSNLPGMPISLSKEEQIVDWVLDYNRKIVNSVDDSIVKVIGNESLLIRRSRGFALNEFKIPSNYLNFNEDFLSVGAELKNTFCIKKNNKLIVSAHMGNILNLESFDNYKKNIALLSDFTLSNFKMLVLDENESFNSSVFAREYGEENSLDLVKVQHHVAHGFSVAFENNFKDFFAIVCDGVGLGSDGKIWGGEVFFNDIRIGKLEDQLMLGGDVSSKDPFRFLIGILSKFMSLEEIRILCSNFDCVPERKDIDIFFKQIEGKFNCIESSSCGRILDAMSVLLGFSGKNFYEGRGAMLLESNSDESFDFLENMYFEPIIEKNSEGLFVLLTTPLFKFAVNVLMEEEIGVSLGNLASFVQNYIAKGMYEIVQMYKLEMINFEYDYEVQEKIDNLPVVFSGGCAYNKFMSSYLINKNVFLNKLVPCGDGGISLGQAAWFLWNENKNKY
ncbi:MAG: carbamoyltransferase HypF [Nanoarchaeota archaeon]|nr:carbamoyltransferase HypF [Nanoarchaeota archaeon]